MCQYRRIFLRFISRISFWALIMTSFSGLTLSNLVFSTFIWLHLVKYSILRILMIYFMQIYCETSYKIQKLFDIYNVMSNAYAFCANIAEFFWQKSFGDIASPCICSNNYHVMQYWIKFDRWTLWIWSGWYNCWKRQQDYYLYFHIGWIWRIFGFWTWIWSYYG